MYRPCKLVLTQYHSHNLTIILDTHRAAINKAVTRAQHPQPRIKHHPPHPRPTKHHNRMHNRQIHLHTTRVMVRRHRLMQGPHRHIIKDRTTAETALPIHQIPVANTAEGIINIRRLLRITAVHSMVVDRNLVSLAIMAAGLFKALQVTAVVTSMDRIRAAVNIIPMEAIYNITEAIIWVALTKGVSTDKADRRHHHPWGVILASKGNGVEMADIDRSIP